MPKDHGALAQIEHSGAHRAFTERVFIDFQVDVDKGAGPSWRGWFQSWEPLREGDELRITLDDGRRGTALIKRVYLDQDLVAPIVSFTGTSPLA